MAQIIGIDFGTTNSLAAYVAADQVRALTGEDDLPHPSVVWYPGARPIVGREAKSHLTGRETGVVGDIVRSPKSYMGTGTSINVAGAPREPSDVVADILRFLREDAVQQGIEFDQAVMSIPVQMTGLARRELREAANKAGFRIWQFVHEPLAALYAFLRSDPEFKRRLAELEGRVVLVFDWGGGTLDLTLCKFSTGTLVQIENRGDDSVGGDRFDLRILNWARDEHARMHRLVSWPGHIPHADDKLIGQSEQAKITLSKQSSYTLFVENYLRSNGPERTLQVPFTQQKLIELTDDLINAGMENIDRLLGSAGYKDVSIEFCLSTGGMCKIPYIQQRLIERFGLARFKHTPDSDQLIAKGAAWVAYDRRGLTLAKPIELLHADNTYITLIPANTPLPVQGQEIIQPNFGLYSVDPRDGVAKIQLCRPARPGRTLPSDPRKPYGTLSLKTDCTAAPFFERLYLDLSIDQDLTMHARARSGLVADEQLIEIQELEFGLAVGSDSPMKTGAPPSSDTDINEPEPPATPHNSGDVQVRSNVYWHRKESPDRFPWELVPGEIAEKYPTFRWAHSLSERQRNEKMYYSACVWCGRKGFEIKLEGCDRPGCPESQRRSGQPTREPS